MCKKSKLELFISKSIEVHGLGRYDYGSSIYLNNRTKIEIKCNKCGMVFLQRPHHHTTQRSGCPKCGNEVLTMKKTKSISSFVNESRNIHGLERYDYSLVDYKNSQTKIKLKCNECGTIFQQRPHLHLSQKCGCPNCASSKGESFIKKWLDENNISYVQQAKFSDCKYVKELRFDFHIQKQQVLLEFNGRQHYEPIGYFGGETTFKQQQISDQIKRLFAKSNGLKLIEIPYTMFDEEIISLLEENLLTSNETPTITN